MFLVGSRLVQKFTNLLDTFSSYTGKAGYYLSVKATEDGLEALVLGFANKALSNLASVAINASLLFDTDNAYDLGSAAKNLRDVYSKLVNTPAVVFPATQVPSANANTLDDYEEGTWTANLICGTSGTIAVNAGYSTGAYTKVGRQVTVTIRIYVDSVSSPVGTLTLTGLPFTCAAGVRFNSAVAIRSELLNATGTTQMQAVVLQGTTNISIDHFAAGNVGAAAADIKAGSQFDICTAYFTD